jgi:hypothetical protein
MGDYQEVSLKRAGVALLIGALVGPPLVIIAETVLGAIPLIHGATWSSVVGSILIPWLAGFLFAIYGLVFIAVPAWWMLHQAGMTTWVHAVLLGVVLTFCYAIAIWVFLTDRRASDSGALLFADGFPTRHGWYSVIQLAVPAAIAGGLVGLIVWRIAYRPLKSVDD